MSHTDRNVVFRYAVAIVLAALVCVLIGRMLWFLHLSISNALRNDQWPMLEEIRAFRDGRVGWGYLWAPYWGHRIVLPRLILLADERWLRYKNAPLVCINVLSVCGSAVILVLTAWRLLGRVMSATTILALTLIAGLMLSAIQLENIVYGMAVQNTVAFVSAIASVALMARSVPGGDAQYLSRLPAPSFALFVSGLGCFYGRFLSLKEFFLASTAEFLALLRSKAS
jgi:hypothetical protein